MMKNTDIYILRVGTVVFFFFLLEIIIYCRELIKGNHFYTIGYRVHRAVVSSAVYNLKLKMLEIKVFDFLIYLCVHSSFVFIR